MSKKTRRRKDIHTQPDYAISDKRGSRYLINNVANAKKSLKAVARSKSNYDKRLVYKAICDRFPGLARESEQIKNWRARSAQKIGSTLSKCAPRKRRKVKRKPAAKIELTQEWVMLGTYPAMQIGTSISPGSRYFAGVKDVELPNYALVTDYNGDLKLVLLTEDWYEGEYSREADLEFSSRTFRTARKRSLVAKLPTRGPWKLEGYIMSIGYTGTLQGQTADYLHTFEGPPQYIFGDGRGERTPPALYSGPDGFRIERGNSKYRVTDRGIVG